MDKHILLQQLKTAMQSSKSYTDKSISDLSAVVDGVIEVLETLEPEEERLSNLEHMVIQNEITAPIATDNDGGTILVLDSGEALIADWKN